MTSRWPSALALPQAFAFVGIAALGLMLGREASTAPRLLIAGLIGLGIALFTFSNLTGGLVLFTFVSFFELLPSAFGGDLSVVKVVGAILTLAWISRVIDRQTGVRVIIWERPWLAAAAAAFAVWGVASVVWATSTSDTTYAAVRLVQLVLLFFVVYSAVSTMRHLRLVVWAFLSGAFVTTVYGLTRGLSAGSTGRLIGGLADPNFLAAAIVAAIVLTVVMIAATRGWQRAVLAAYLAVFLPSLFFTGSRGGLAALGVAIVAAMILGGPARGQLVALALVVGAVTVSYYAILAPAAVRDRVTSISAQDSAGRIDQYKIALQIFHDQPLQGVALGNYTIVQPDYITSTTSFFDVSSLIEGVPIHNVYLSVLAELGLLGVFLLLAVIGSSLALGVVGYRQRARAGDREGELLCRGVVIATAAFLVAYAFLPGLYDKQLWLVLGLSASLAGLRDSDTARA